MIKEKSNVARLVCAASLCLSMCLSFFSVCAEELPHQLFEQKIKAGLVYNLLKYTTWPKEIVENEKESVAKEKEVLQICLFGDDPFDGYLSPLQGRTAQQSLISIIHIKEINEIVGCNVLIIHRNQENQLAKLLGVLKDKHILTISDITQFSQRGGMIELTKEGEKVSLYINKDAISRAGLDIEPQMLKLAKIVSG